MNQYYGIESSQIQNINIQTVLRVFGLPSYSGTPILYHLVHSKIVLTPEQSFNIYYNTSSSSRNLQELIYFKQSKAITWNNITYTIIKTTSRPLSCVGKKIYNQRSYTVIDDDKIQINSTGKTYERSQYYGDIGNYVVVCEEYMPNGCQLTKVGLTKNDVTIYKNLALKVKNTRMFYDRGNYEVSNGLISLCKTRESSTPTCSTRVSCKGRCSNKTEWRNIVEMTCSCDQDCHKVFGDCCSDYTKYCGAQTSGETPRKTYNYTCEDFGNYDSSFCTVADGVWMVSGCTYEWPRDSTRSKCEIPIKQLPQSLDILTNIFGYLPVISKDNTTFRNRYCAICNNEMEYNYWPLKFKSAVMPPETSNITKIIRFLEKYNARFGGDVGPAADQARRYCLRSIINKCPPGKEDPSCDYGNLNLVSFGNLHYTNTRCAVCDGLSKDRVSNLQCFPYEISKTCPSGWQTRSLSIVLGHKRRQNEVIRSVPIYDERCEKKGLVYDDKLHVCRVNWLPSPEENGREIFYVLSWLQPSQNQFEILFTAMDFQNSLSKYLNMTREQFFYINISVLPDTEVTDRQTSIIQFYIVETKIILTPQQSLQFLFNTINATEFDKRTREFIYFREEFSLQIKNLNYTIIKTTSRPLACVGKVTYTPEDYILQQNERVLIRNTNETFEHYEYYRERKEKLSAKQGNITVCKKYVPTKCNGTEVIYSPQEYNLMNNLTIYVFKTFRTYYYGEYEILSNYSVKTCQTFVVKFVKRIREVHNEALGYITFVFFLISIIFLTFLLVTYIIFPQLRTLPGKNIMNFAFTLLLFEIFWLPTNFTKVTENENICKAFAIIEHYFLLASFFSMVVIAHHTRKVFGKKLPAPKMSPGHKRKLFYVYLCLVWIIPALFIAICVVLDSEEIINLGYGERDICWLTGTNSYVYFVTIPVILMLMFNVVEFVRTAIQLRKHAQNQAGLTASGKRSSNLSIYIRLSTLMGFTWLFGLLGQVVTSTSVFYYLFVIFTSLEGFFVAWAFVLNAKTLNLYRHRFRNTDKTSSSSRNPTRKLLSKSDHKETKM
ncbi:uncharacterized protein LOC124434614 [Xenia sp. Carnegie-2017]|uniref:uncharacterized protein LOC124434614 n=1 Tax=Xenia sp. Carnegie-2017 TaxID=2897299 RepID=UPI001F041E53|nr:uncharacterized protein LOC124434614 [Xenia sp. Carnegie-2017]